MPRQQETTFRPRGPLRPDRKAFKRRQADKSALPANKRGSQLNSETADSVPRRREATFPPRGPRGPLLPLTRELVERWEREQARLRAQVVEEDT